MAITTEGVKQKRAELSAALRSGKYRQTQGVLRRVDGFCCLGVACVINGAEITGTSNATYKGEEVDRNSLLPAPLAEELGFDGDAQTVLARLNDTGSTFAHIADHIDALPLPAEVA